MSLIRAHYKEKLNMENKLDVLTKKLYDEGINKAQQEAEVIIDEAQQEAREIIRKAKEEVETVKQNARLEISNLKKKAESEMSLSARQATTALKQSITNLLTDKVAGEMAKVGFDDKKFVQQLILTIVKKWDISSGNINLVVVLPESEKEQFESYVASQYKELLDKGLQVKVGNMKEGFIIEPKDGSYRIAFSEQLFESFFSQYMREFTKQLLYREND
ncbi:MAG: V-type ATP synthase subunit E [Odoribacter sp.]|nr:V-type ATP synthase subunit E [Odoribacter sp.]